MYVKQIYTKCLAEASYYIESKGEAVVIDPIREYEPYLDLLAQRGAKLKYIIETHFHADFVSGHLDLQKKTGAPILFGPGAKPNYEIMNVEDGQDIIFGDIRFQVMHTPGHTLESICLLMKDESDQNAAVFTGDTLFVGDVGRPDLLGVKMSKEELASMMYHSLNQKLKKLEDDVVVYPGHGAGSACGKNISQETHSTIGIQKKTNYAMLIEDREAFIKEITKDLPAPPPYFPFNVKMNQRGYSSIDEVREKSHNGLRVLEAKALMKQGAIVLDVRSASKVSLGYIKGSIHVGLDGNFAPWVGLLVPFDRDIVLVVDDQRIDEAILRLSRIGYDRVVGYLMDGVKSWSAAGGELSVVEQVSGKDFLNEQLNEGEVLLDVRYLSEYALGAMAGAKHICLSQISSRLSELKDAKKIYVYCAGGYRSMMGCVLLQGKLDATVINIEGGYGGIPRQCSLKFAQK